MLNLLTHSGNLRRWNAITWALLSIEGVIALAGLLRIPSEGESAIAFGFSFLRLMVISITIITIAIVATFAWASMSQPAWWRTISNAVNRFFSSELRGFSLFSVMFAIFILMGVFLSMAAFLGPENAGNLWPIYERMGFLMAWILLGMIQLGVLILYNIKTLNLRRIFTDRLYLAALLAIVTIVYTAVLRYHANLHWELRMLGWEGYLFIPATIFLLWGVCERIYQNRIWYERLYRLFLVLSIAAVTLVLYRHTAFWMGWVNTPPKAYWPSLSEAFIHGRLYLENPPGTHDLTFYNGEWYVPNPPLPAFILLPLVALKGADNINTVSVSIVIGVINVVLIYLLLAKASGLGMIPTTQSGNLWLTALFALSTSHWWLSFAGRMWFVSQLLTLTFAALAVLSVLLRQSPLLAGLYLGAAVLARPNVFTLWPFLTGIFIYLHHQKKGTIQWRLVLSWMAQSAIPVCLAVAGLLYYNYIRFDDWFDFGYVTIDGADWIMEAVRTYGMFNIHFVPININAMLIKMPRIQLADGRIYYSPGLEGTSIFAMMPAVIYIFRRFKFDWWTSGAWISVFLSIGLLLFYHNTGAWQLGYRYVLDFILPLLLLLSIGVGPRPTWGFKLLTLVGIVGSLAGIAWWYLKWWYSAP